MKKHSTIILILLLLAALLSACAQTTLTGTGNEAYRTEKTDTVQHADTEAETARMVFVTPKKNEIPPHYFKVRVPGVKSILYVFSDETGTTHFRVHGRLSGEDTETGFFPVTLREDANGTLYSMELAAEESVKPSDDRPGTPRREDARPAPESEVQPHWLKVPGRDNLYHIRDKDGKYQFRQWAHLGEEVGFYPCNDAGIMIRGGVPDAVKIQGKWVAVRIMNPMTFAYTPPEPAGPDETEEVVITPPQTEGSEAETPRTDPPRTERPATERPRPPVTEPPATEPPSTEPPVTEPPVTEPPETEPPVTEPPVTEPPETEPPGEPEPPEDPEEP